MKTTDYLGLILSLLVIFVLANAYVNIKFHDNITGELKIHSEVEVTSTTDTIIVSYSLEKVDSLLQVVEELRQELIKVKVNTIYNSLESKEQAEDIFRLHRWYWESKE